MPDSVEIKGDQKNTIVEHENVHGLSVVDDEVHGLSALWLVILVILAGVIGLVWVLVT
jgi:hypothetical protein